MRCSLSPDTDGHGCEAVVDNQAGSFTWLNRTGQVGHQQGLSGAESIRRRAWKTYAR